LAKRRRLSFYERRVFPWLNDKMGADPQLIQTRAEAPASARGRVVEIGFGSGPNLAHYPETVRRIVGIEPNDGMCDRAAPQVRLSRIPVDLIVAEAESLPFADASRRVTERPTASRGRRGRASTLQYEIRETAAQHPLNPATPE
jgi:SAM-dependent methyltransferase